MPSLLSLVPVSACVALLLFAAVAGCSSQGSSPAVQQTPATLATVVNTIAIKDFVFTPSSLTVKAGTTVTWVNEGSATHTVEADKSSAIQFASDLLPPGGTFSVTFKEPGTYPYHCSIHPSMVGTIFVES